MFLLAGCFWLLNFQVRKVYVAISILKFILRQQIISNELLYAALAVYLIFGLAWASIYQLLELGQSGSFSLPDSPASTQTYIFQMWYFSMVTLTTLGYGDIVPVSMAARVFVVLEAPLCQDICRSGVFP